MATKIWAIAGVMVLALATAAAGEEFRTWSDATGKFKLQAKLLSRDGARVTLERDNGAKVTIEVSKLSAADQQYLASLDSDSPFQPVEDSPFQPVPESRAAAGTARNVTVDWSKSMSVLLEASREWKIDPPVSAADFRAKSVAVPPKTDFFEKLAGAAVNPLARKAVVAYNIGRDKTAQTRVVLCDLEKGKTIAAATEPGHLAPLAVHDNGQYILMRRNDFGFGNLDRLEIWAIGNGAVAKHLIWTPYDDVRGAGRDVMWAEFIDAGTLATSSRGGKVALWKVASAEPICHFQLSDGAIPAMSEDRKWIAFASDAKVGLFDVQKREVAVLAETPAKLTWPHMAISPTGRKIVCIAQDRILVWDTATGQLERDFGAPGLHIHGEIDFPDDNFLLANNQYLIALDSQIKLWQYRSAEYVRTAGGNTFIAVSAGTDKPGALMATKLPHQEAKALLEKALNQPDLFVFREGTSVKLDVNGIPAEQRERVAKALTAKLSEMKCSVAPNGTIDVVAKTEGPKQKQVSFINSGDYQVSEYYTKLSFVYQGKTAWETGNTNIPGIVSLKAGENIEGVLRKASQGPEYGFYDRVVLPRFLQKPGDQSAGGGQTLGNSNITPEGVR